MKSHIRLFAFYILPLLFFRLLFSQQSYTFTTAGNTGSVGPSQAMINANYAFTSLSLAVLVTSGIQTWTVPVSGIYHVDISGACGADAPMSFMIGGLGARMQGDFNFLAGDVIQVLVGQRGLTCSGCGAGGGGTFLLCNNNLLIAAGGGGGASFDANGVPGSTLTNGTMCSQNLSSGGINGSGGITCLNPNPLITNVGNAGAGGGYLAGALGNGFTVPGSAGGGFSFLNGGVGGSAILGGCPGGFGGGGAARPTTCGGGGGGGYSGGAGGQQLNVCSTAPRSGGGGGGSYNIGFNQVNTPGFQSGNGVVIITYLCPPISILTATNTICSGNSAILTCNGQNGFVWSNNSTASSITVSPTITTIYSVVAQSTSNCLSFTSYTLNVIQPTLTVAASNATICNNSSVSFTANSIGGTPPYTYTWTSGPTSNEYSVVLNNIGLNQFTVNSYDANNCFSSQTITVNVIATPSISISSTTICPQQIAMLNAIGANTYTWLPSNTTGNSFTQSPIVSTQYTVIGEAFSCSSITTASIIVKPLPNPIVTHNTPLCENQHLFFSVSSGTSAVWSGPSAFTSTSINNTLSSVQLNQSGLYSVTVTAANSCTASASASLTVKPLPQFSIAPASSSICANTTSVSLSVSSSTSASTYTWLPNSGLSSANGTLVNAIPGSTTIYTVIGSLNGCTNVAYSTVNVVPPPSLSAQLSSNTLCSQAFNGSPNTITLTAGGASSYTLQTFPDMSNNNPGGPVSQLTAIPPYTGIGSATLSGSNGVCTVSLTTTFSILPNPTITVNNYTPVICAGETFTYTNQGANTYTWNSATPNFTTFSNGGVAVAHPSVNSVFSVFGGSLGCNSALHTSTITVNPLPQVTVSPNPAKVCFGNTVELSAIGNGTSFVWLPPYGLNNYTNSTVVSHMGQSQNYTVIATLNHCSNTAVALLSVMPLPNPVIVPIKDEVCLYEEIHLRGEGGIYYEWQAPNLQTFTIQNLQLPISHMNLSGLFTLKIVGVNGCANYSTQPVVVHDLPNGYLQPEATEFCVPNCLGFEFKANPSNQNITAGNWSMDGKIYSSDSFSICFTKDKTYTISGPISNEFNCKNTVSVSVIGRAKPAAEFYTTPENPIEGLDEVQFVNVSSNVVDFGWQASGLTSIDPSAPSTGSAQGVGMTQNAWMQFKSEDESPRYMFEEAGIYGLMLMVKNEYNCWDTVMHTINVESDFAAYIPNAFTPNGDDLNDTFYPVMRGVKKFELQIFDRWGELIFSSNNPEQVWDGTFKGQECKQGVYNYKLVLLNVEREEKVYTGSISLYR